MNREEFYDEKIAKLRDSLFREKSSAFAETFFFSLIGRHLQEDQTILDIGTGNGYVLSELLSRFPQYHLNLFGVDNSCVMINQARKLLEGRALIHFGDNSKLPYKDDSFDLVTAKNVTSICIPEIRRVLHEKGYFVFREYGPGKGLVEVSTLFPRERLIRSRSLNYYLSILKENDFEIEIAEQHEIKRYYSPERLIEVIKSFPFIEDFSERDEKEILNRFNSPLEEITSDPLIIVARRKK
jgi:SAM-dependent methyltransferase